LIIISSEPARASPHGLVLESGEPREVHHLPSPSAYGCSAINRISAMRTIDDLIQRASANTDHKKAVKKFLKDRHQVRVVKRMAQDRASRP